jgi:meso-butanediol dehydrogenase / (S,S)-butanediol dehydrogenase / diacetyl reductase
MQQLTNKIIFLTGGSMGIGLECAKKYKEEGARVMIMSNDEDSLAKSQQIMGDDHSTFFGDVSIGSNVEQAILFTLDRYGKIDVIHNNAGIAYPCKPLHETDEAAWQQLFDINMKSILFTTRYGLESLKKTKGCILNTSSIVGEIGQENHAAYSATKGALNALTKSMALDYAQFKIRVNAVAPAGVWTPMLQEWGEAQEDTAKIKKYLDDIHTLGYCPHGDVVADACVFIVSEKARFITGSIMPVTGGAELGYRRFS